MTLITPSHYKQIPWKNGGGVTNEILRSPANGDFDFRISQANVSQDGPFSLFNGYDRILMVIEGEGFKLNQKIYHLSDVIHFRGEEEINCHLVSGPIRDLGLIYRRDKFKGEMKWVGPGAIREDEGRHFLYCLDNLSLDQETILAGSTLQFEGALNLNLREGSAVLISLFPTSVG